MRRRRRRRKLTSHEDGIAASDHNQLCVRLVAAPSIAGLSDSARVPMAFAPPVEAASVARVRKGWWAVVLAGLASSSLGTACGGNTGSGNGTGPTGTCDSVCEKVIAQGCPNDTLALCNTNCEQAFATFNAACPAETGGYLGCLQTRAVLQCGPTGEATADPQQVQTVCPSEVRAQLACTACLPDPSDTACDTCQKTSCCTQWRAAVSHPDVFAFGACLDGCSSSTSTTCTSDCLDRFPSYRQAVQTMVDCRSAQCSTC